MARLTALMTVGAVQVQSGVDPIRIDLVFYDNGSGPKQDAPIATKLTSQDDVVAAVSGSQGVDSIRATPRGLFGNNSLILLNGSSVSQNVEDETALVSHLESSFRL